MFGSCASWLPFILTGLIGLATAYWIWGGRKTSTLAEPRSVEVDAPPVSVPVASAPLAGVPVAAVPVTAMAAAAGTIAVAAKVAAKPKAKAVPVKAAAAPKAAAPKTAAPKPTALPKTAAKPAAAAKPKAVAKPKVIIPDNLELLKGVGPKLNGLLKSLGVTSFEQVANWKPSDVREIDSKLGNFAGRVGRDNWIDQAKLLMKGDVKGFEKKYGPLGSEIKK